MVTYTIMAALQAGLTTLLGYLSAHVLTCLIPAFFIAGAIAALKTEMVLKSLTEMVLKYFGKDAPKWLCYSVAATSGTILAVCSCTILPMFAGIEKKGAGIGPATAFLFSGPAINLLAIVLTARVLGLDIGIARAISRSVHGSCHRPDHGCHIREKPPEMRDLTRQCASSSCPSDY